MKKNAETKKGQTKKEVREKMGILILHLSISLAPSFPERENRIYRC